MTGKWHRLMTANSACPAKRLAPVTKRYQLLPLSKHADLASVKLQQRQQQRVHRDGRQLGRHIIPAVSGGGCHQPALCGDGPGHIRNNGGGEGQGWFAAQNQKALLL